MGTLVSNPAVLASYNPSMLFKRGIDPQRSSRGQALGTWRANSATSFRAGQGVGLNSDNEVVIFNGTAASGMTFLGVAAWSKVSLSQSTVVDEEIVFTVADSTENLKHAPIVSGSVIVLDDTVSNGGSAFTVTTDYTVNATNGTITHVSGGSIALDTTVYVSYAWALTESDYQLEGKNFWQSEDYVTIQDGRITVLEAPCTVYTTEFDPSRVYTLTGTTSNVYCNASGNFTTLNDTTTKLVGKVVGLPTASMPYLGIRLHGQVAANA